MNRLFVYSRYNKFIFFSFVGLFVDLIVIFGLIIFDIVELILIAGNSAKLSSVFVALNIVLIALCVLTIAFFVVKTILEKRRGDNEFKEN